MNYINLVDDYFKASEKETNDIKIDSLEDEIYRLKCELVDKELEKEDLEYLVKKQKEEIAKKEDLEERLKAFTIKFKEKEEELASKNQKIELQCNLLEESEEEQLRLMEENEELKKQLERVQNAVSVS
ncbi:hypothetical protein P261_01650 [Lachnospiraceae bacterium TWA4]|nr:hypothetical protein P261_01650 [Lachnospiraceae bacterium TWA4]